MDQAANKGSAEPLPEVIDPGRGRPLITRKSSNGY
jgi:hypothetical protein